MAKKQLATYRGKRDFTRTREPSGNTEIRADRQRRFVVQKHDASHLHYDFRLELDGVFKSWAVTKGPSLDPHDKRLAVQVEDHPLDYGDFEGTIPKGQYGGGTVQIWDRGFWKGDQPRQGLRKGELLFKLEGEKLRGDWMLVRMRGHSGHGSHKNWLLIKRQDKDAREGKANAVLESDRSVASGRSMEDIATGGGKDTAPFMTNRARRRTGNTKSVSDRKPSVQSRRKGSRTPLG
jgi:bifunctional non-homologous end joining protein LigD